MVVYPGLINTHHHLYQIFSHNLPEVQKMALFPWLFTLYEVWKNIDEEVIGLSSLTGVTATVTGSADDAALKKAVEDAGYTVSTII